MRRMYTFIAALVLSIAGLTASAQTPQVVTAADTTQRATTLEDGAYYYFSNRAHGKYNYDVAFGYATSTAAYPAVNSMSARAFAWKCIKNGDNYQFQNLYTKKYLPSLAGNDNGTPLYTSSTPGNFTLTVSGDTLKFRSVEDPTKYLNGNPDDFTSWEDPTPFFLHKVTVSAPDLAFVVANQALLSQPNYVGSYTQAQMAAANAAKTAYTANTSDATLQQNYVTAFAALLEQQPVFIDTTKVYQLINKHYAGQRVCSDNATGTTLVGSGNPGYRGAFQFVRGFGSTKKYQLYSVPTGKYVYFAVNNDVLFSLIPEVDRPYNNRTDFYVVNTTSGTPEFSFGLTTTITDQGFLHLGRSGIVRWSADGDASRFYLLPMEGADYTIGLAAKANLIKAANYKARENYVNGYTSTDVAPVYTAWWNFRTAFNTTQKTALDNAITTLESKTRIALDASKVYQVIAVPGASDPRQARVLSTNAAGTALVTVASSNTADLKQLFHFDISSTGSNRAVATMRSLASGKKVQAIAQSTQVALGDAGANVTVENRNFAEAILWTGGTYSHLHAANNTDKTVIGYTSGDRASFWALRPVSTYDAVKIDQYQYVTYSSAAKKTLPANVEAYKAAINNGYVVLTQVAGTTLPAGTGVVLKSTTPDYYFLNTTTSAADMDFADNILQASVTETAQTSSVYVLTVENNEVLFGKTVAGTAIPANRAFFTVSGSGAPAFALSFGDVTSIDKVATTTTESADIYDLYGRKVTNPKSGLYIINGKKVLIK